MTRGKRREKGGFDLKKENGSKGIISPAPPAVIEPIPIVVQGQEDDFLNLFPNGMVVEPRTYCDTVIEMGDAEEILGLPSEVDASLDLGHFLLGGRGLGSLSISCPEEELNAHPPPLLPSSCSIISLCAVTDCAKTATFLCSACKRVYYCGEKHQKLHWTKHEEDCVPFRRGVATRDINSGQEIFTEKPLLLFAMATLHEQTLEEILECPALNSCDGICTALLPACLGCRKSVEFVGPERHMCRTCGLPLCSRNCEFRLSHQAGECAVINASEVQVDISYFRCFHTLYLDIEVLRTLSLRQKSESDWKLFFELGNNDRTRYYKSTSSFLQFRSDISKLLPLSVKVVNGDSDLIGYIHAIIKTHSYFPSLSTTWKALFGTQADFIHSCLPNTVQYLENERMGDEMKMRLNVKAAVGIGKEEILTVDCLPSPYLSFLQRKRILENRGISCRCMRCTNPVTIGDDSGIIRCAYCVDAFIRPEDPLFWDSSRWFCEKCQRLSYYSSVSKVENLLLQDLNRLRSKNVGYTGYMEFIKKANQKLHPSNAIIITAWCSIENLIWKTLERRREPDIRKEYDHDTMLDFSTLKKYTEAVLPHLNAIKPGLWVDKGIVEFQKSYCDFVFASRDFQEGKIDKKEFTRKFFKCLKLLDSSLQILIQFEGMESTQKILEEATYALTTLKKIAAELILPTSKNFNEESIQFQHRRQKNNLFSLLSHK